MKWIEEYKTQKGDHPEMSNRKNKTKTEWNCRDDAAVLLRPCHAQQKSEKQFRDTKAEELIDRIDYDFSNDEKGTAMSGGIVAR